MPPKSALYFSLNTILKIKQKIIHSEYVSQFSKIRELIDI